MDIVVVAEKRADALLHVALAPPPHVEPISHESVKSSGIHQIHRINSRRVVFGDARGALQVLRTRRPVLAEILRTAGPAIARRVALLIKRSPPIRP